jgi:hypothetical protein
MSDRLPASFALDESSPEPSAARCALNPPLRLDRARSRHTLAPGQRPGNTSRREEIGGTFEQRGQELDAASGRNS